MRKPQARKIISEMDHSITHRAGVWTCPHCDYQEDNYSVGKWEKGALTLVLAIVHGKHGSVVVISECPKCFKKSWVHAEFSRFEEWSNTYPKEWKEAAIKERDRRHIASLIRFTDSLCARCRHLRRLECNTIPIVDCTYGRESERLHHCFAETKCKAFALRK